MLNRISLYAAALLVMLGGSRAWAELPVLPQPATSFGAAVADGWLYVYGGNTGKAHEFHRDCIKGDFFRVKLPDGAAWEALPGDAPLLGAAMAEYGGKVYRIGGMQALNAKGEKNQLRSTTFAVQFHPDTQRWESLPPLPEPRSSHDIAVDGDTLYVGGGWKLADGNDGEWHKTLLTLNLREPEKGWKSRPAPFQRRAIAAVAHAGRIWFLGGMDSEDKPSRAVDWFEPKTGEWGKGPELPDGPMAGFGMAACSAGGALLTSPLSGAVYALSADEKNWEEVARLAKPRFFHRLLPTADGRVVAVGGSSRSSQILEPEFLSVKSKTAALSASEKSTQAASNSSAALKAPSLQDDVSWSQWRGPQRDGISPETGWQKTWPAEGPGVLWKVNVGAGMSSPVIADGRLFIQGNDGKGTDSVFAFDAATGKELWRHSFPCASSPHEMPIVPAGPGATPTVSNRRIFALSREGDLVCLQVASGELAWRKQLIADLGGKRPVYGYAQSPLIEAGRVFLDVGCAPEQESSTAALDATTGEVVWRAGKGEAGYSSARVFEHEGQRLVAMFKGEGLQVFNPADGKVLWSYKTTARDFCNAATPTFVGNRIFVSNTGTSLAALLDWNLGKEPEVREVWTHKQLALLFNSAIVHDQSLFAFNEKRRGHNEFTCVDAQTGETRWVSDAVPTGTFILADNHWIFLTREGEVVIAPATSKGVEPVARFKALEDKCYATPALADGRLYVRSNTGDLVAYDLRADRQGTSSKP
ncbi:outer membrane protein assembly factor BamB family protein [Verrucomicrobiota bacterium sgz303538]